MSWQHVAHQDEVMGSLSSARRFRTYAPNELQGELDIVTHQMTNMKRYNKSMLAGRVFASSSPSTQQRFVKTPSGSFIPQTRDHQVYNGPLHNKRLRHPRARPHQSYTSSPHPCQSRTPLRVLCNRAWNLRLLHRPIHAKHTSPLLDRRSRHRHLLLPPLALPPHREVLQGILRSLGHDLQLPLDHRVRLRQPGL